MTKMTDREMIREEFRGFLLKSEHALADIGQRWGDSLAELVPGDGERIRELVDEAFDFTEKLVRNQRELANAMLDAVLGEQGKSHDKAAAHAAEKAAPKRAAARPAGKPRARKAHPTPAA